MKRTALATLATLGLVALVATVYWSPRWAGRYFVSGVWAMAFFALTPLIFHVMLLRQRRWTGLGLIALKIAWMGLLFWICRAWAIASDRTTADGSAVIAGVVTPLAVVVLRAIGTVLDWSRPAPGGSARRAKAPDPRHKLETRR